MKRKIFTLILAAISATVFTFGLSACGEREHEHKYGELRIVENATCTEEGVGVRICNICGDEIIEVIDPLGHDLQTVKGKEPTCIDEGYADYQACLRSGCGYNTKQIIPATGVHVYDENNLCIYCQREKTVPKFDILEDENGNPYAVFLGVDGLEETDFVIPSEIDGIPVTVIAKEALKGKPITSVTIPATVKIIGEFAFEETLITEIVIPDSVTEIGDGAFEGCGGLITINIPDSIQKIGGAAFENCESLVYNRNDDDNANFLGNGNNPYLVFVKADNVANITISESTKIIYGDAFFECTNLKSIDIPDSVIDIGASTFQFCENLERITLPKTLNKISQFMFSGCKRLSEINPSTSGAEVKVNLPQNITEIGEGAFENCKSLERIEIPNKVTSIGASAFVGCGISSDDEEYYLEEFEGRGLKEVTFEFGSLCKSIGYNAFTLCHQIENFVLPDGLPKIQYGTFSSCKNLEWIYIPDSVQEIEGSIFEDCNSLQYIYYGGTTAEQWEDVEFSVQAEKSLLAEKVYFYSVTPPQEAGRYWWWNGDPTLW